MRAAPVHPAGAVAMLTTTISSLQGRALLGVDFDDETVGPSMLLAVTSAATFVVAEWSR